MSEAAHGLVTVRVSGFRGRVGTSLMPGYATNMRLRATVRNGRLTVDQPVDLPEGTVFDLVIDDEGDQLEGRERDALNAAISRSLREDAEGRTAPADEIIEKLRARRSG